MRLRAQGFELRELFRMMVHHVNRQIFGLFLEKAPDQRRGHIAAAQKSYRQHD